MPPGLRTTDMRLAISTGVRTDTSAQVVPVSDLNNVVVGPDGSEILCRGGLELRQHQNTYGVPPNKCVIIKQSAPPDVGLGNMFTIMDGTEIIRIDFMRDRTQLEGQPIITTILFDTDNFVAGSGDQDIGNVLRQNDASIALTFYLKTADGTAIGGVNFSALNGIDVSSRGSLAIAEMYKLITIRNVVPAVGVNTYFYVDIFRAVTAESGATIVIGSPARITVTITGS